MSRRSILASIPRYSRRIFAKNWADGSSIVYRDFSCRASNRDSRRSFSDGGTPTRRTDPLARRPNRICDPYGLGGKPLSYDEAMSQLVSFLQEGWTLETRTTSSSNADEKNDDKTPPPPTALVREFHHADYIQAAQFVRTVAAVAHNNNHYPSILLERHLLSHAWQVTTRVTCFTPTLQGLSHSDFYIAMLVDVEVERPEIQNLLLSKQPGSKRR